jgi:hypothetical protein
VPYTYAPTTIPITDATCIVKLAVLTPVVDAYGKIAIENTDRKSDGQDKYLLLAVVRPVTFLRKGGICTEL